MINITTKLLEDWYYGDDNLPLIEGQANDDVYLIIYEDVLLPVDFGGIGLINRNLRVCLKRTTLGRPM